MCELMTWSSITRARSYWPECRDKNIYMLRYKGVKDRHYGCYMGVDWEEAGSCVDSQVSPAAVGKDEPPRDAG